MRGPATVGRPHFRSGLTPRRRLPPPAALPLNSCAARERCLTLVYPSESAIKRRRPCLDPLASALTRVCLPSLYRAPGRSPFHTRVETNQYGQLCSLRAVVKAVGDARLVFSSPARTPWSRFRQGPSVARASLSSSLSTALLPPRVSLAQHSTCPAS